MCVSAVPPHCGAGHREWASFRVRGKNSHPPSCTPCGRLAPALRSRCRNRAQAERATERRDSRVYDRKAREVSPRLYKRKSSKKDSRNRVCFWSQETSLKCSARVGCHCKREHRHTLLYIRSSALHLGHARHRSSCSPARQMRKPRLRKVNNLPRINAASKGQPSW